MSNEEIQVKLPNLLPQIILTVLVAAGTTIGANYTNAKLTEASDKRQNEMLLDMERRLREIEVTRYTSKQAEQDRAYIIRELDRIYIQLEKLSQK